MAKEIEAKMKVGELGPVRERLKAAGAARAGEHFEVNTFFDTPQGSLRQADKGMRIRANRDQGSGKTEYIVTYKGPREAGVLKTRREIEFGVDDPKAFAEMLGELGYETIISFEKRRESWKFGGCKVELDELPYLGCYVEIEGPGEKEVMAAREKLGMGDEAIITTGYAALMSEYLKSHNIASPVVIFS